MQSRYVDDPLDPATIFNRFMESMEIATLHQSTGPHNTQQVPAQSMNTTSMEDNRDVTVSVTHTPTHTEVSIVQPRRYPDSIRESMAAAAQTQTNVRPAGVDYRGRYEQTAEPLPPWVAPRTTRMLPSWMQTGIVDPTTDLAPTRFTRPRPPHRTGATPPTRTGASLGDILDDTIRRFGPAATGPIQRPIVPAKQTLDPATQFLATLSQYVWEKYSKFIVRLTEPSVLCVPCETLPIKDVKAFAYAILRVRSRGCPKIIRICIQDGDVVMYEPTEICDKFMEDSLLDARERTDKTACSVCLEDVYTYARKDEPVSRTLLCGHQFHANCIAPWFVNGNDACPLCRTVCNVQENVARVHENISLRSGPITTANNSQPFGPAAADADLYGEPSEDDVHLNGEWIGGDWVD